MKGIKKGRTVATLFLTMLKIGLFTFGGGYAMISLLQNEFVARKKWIGETDFLDMVALSESTPGPIAINSATYIGYRMAGIVGSLAATFGVCIPSCVSIYIISLFFDRFLALTVVANAFRGVQACVVYLILSAGFRMLKTVQKKAFSITVLAVTVGCMLLFSLLAVSFSAVFYILLAGAAGLVLFLIGKLKKEGRK